jgi:hypothetical protein
MRLTRFAVAVAVLVGMAGVANAETVMKQCGEQWQASLSPQRDHFADSLLLGLMRGSPLWPPAIRRAARLPLQLATHSAPLSRRSVKA